MNKLAKIFCAFACILSFQANAELFKASEFTLENGLHCVVVENHKAPIVKSMIWYKVGSIDEAYGKGGLAHLLEHLMFRGTDKVKDGRFNTIMDENGVQSNAFTSYDFTAYHQFADISRLEILLALEADRMRHLNFSDEAFEAEQKIVIQERQQTVENNPNSTFYERLNLLLWGNSPYGQPIGGFTDEIKALSADDMRAFYKKFYAPNNAILVLSGDIDAQTAKPLIEKYFAHLQAEKIERSVPPDSRESYDETLQMALPDVTTVKIEQRFMLPNYNNLQPSFYAYILLAEYLGGGETSELYRNLVLKDKTAVAISTSFRYITRGNSIFSITMLPREDTYTSLNNSVELLQKHIHMAMQSFDESKLEYVKRKVLADLVYLQDNPEDAAYMVGYMMANNFTLEQIQKYENGINRVKTQDVQQAYTELMKAPKLSAALLPISFKGGNNE